MTNISRACALLVALVLAAPATLAETAPATMDLQTPSTAKVWVNLGGFSRHFDRTRGHNENNYGLGLEYRTSQQLSYTVGTYHNSLRKQTTFAAVNWQPWSVGPVQVGAAIGLMNGYPALNRGGNFFAVLPMLSYEGQRFGVNVGVIPTLKNVDGAVIIQFKVRVK